MATVLAALLALPPPVSGQSWRSTSPSAGTRASTGPVVVLHGNPRLAPDRSTVVVLDEIREPPTRRQPELALGIEPARTVPFVRIRGHGLVLPPGIVIHCGQVAQPVPLTSSSVESGRVTGIYHVPSEFATTRLAPGRCYIALGSALVAVPYEMTVAVWGRAAAGHGGPAPHASAPAARAACVEAPPDTPSVPARLSSRARSVATRIVETLRELNAWAHGPAPKSREEYLERLAALERVAKEFATVAGEDRRLARLVDDALDCFREAARSWPVVHAPWTSADRHVRAAERSVNPELLARPAEVARPAERGRAEAPSPRPEAKPQETATREARRPGGPAPTSQPAAGALPAKALARATSGPVPLAFQEGEYFFRSAKNGLYEFTPTGEEDLTAWKSMLSIVVYDAARTADDLADVANRVLEMYGSRGKVLRTDSKPRTRDREAEHFAAAVLGTPTLLEAVFVRFVLVEQTGVAMIFSKRIYGRRVGDEMSAWLSAHAPRTEQALMSWTGMPSLAALKALSGAR